jgi:DNA replication and repair protein RecF
LKGFSLNRNYDEESLLIWDQQLLKYGEPIARKRKQFIEDFHPRFQAMYEAVSGGKEEVGLEHNTQLEEDNLEHLLLASREKDRALNRTTAGVHKDDLVFSIGGYPLKKFGSQGQQKSFLIALKLAQFEFVRDLTGFKPLLLLDDIFDKIDDHRVAYLLKLVSEDHFGQIFVTDTHADRVPKLFEQADAPIRVFQVEEGEIKPLEKAGHEA